jgi:uncharacterized protein (DUF58 family)
LLGEFWVYLFVLLLGIGFAIRNQVLVVISVIGLAVAGGAWLWGRLAVERLTYRRVLARRRVFQHEEIAMTMTIDNRKRLPLARVRVRDTFPLEVEIKGKHLQVNARQDGQTFTRATSLGAYERVRWTYTLRPRQRGFYRLGPADLQTTDLFGFFPRSRPQSQEEFLLVFPAGVPLPSVAIPPRRPIGGERGGAWFPQPDPSRPSGVRDYLPGDPPKLIDWKATARQGSLQVKQFEPGAARITALFLDADTVGATFGGMIPLHLERAVAVTTSLAEQLLAEGEPVALYTNCRSVMIEHPMRVPPSRRPEQHTLIMETLGMVAPFIADRMDNLLLRQARALPAGSSLVVITAMGTPEMANALTYLARTGREPLVLWVAAWPPEGIPESIPCVDLSRHLADVEVRGEAPYMEGIELRRAWMPHADKEQAVKLADQLERAHLEARDVTMA